MRRMVEVAGARLIEGDHPELSRPLPAGVVLYDVSGPLFFGAAEKATSVLGQLGEEVRVLVMRLDGVPAIDATGLVALESALDGLRRRRTLAILSGLPPQPRRVLADAGVVAEEGRLLLCPDLASSLAAAEAALESLRGSPHLPTSGGTG
jgi:SulP family sulfate permease